MSTKVIEIQGMLKADDASAWVSGLWDTWNNQRREWVEDKKELRNYIFATDTTTTTNSSLPWKNSTTLPKLCQIRDNLHSNYLTAMFPNENWLQWEANTRDSNKKEVALVIEGYLANKCRKSGYRSEVSKLLYDYIDYGNAFVGVAFDNKFKINSSGEKVLDYVGPRACRISPLDIVFNPLAARFEDTPKIIRSLKSIGELKLLAAQDPDQAFWSEAIERRKDIQNKMGSYSIEDFDKAVGYSVDGFGSYYEYLQSDYMEVLELFGDYHDRVTGELSTNRLITVVDRGVVVRNVDIPTYSGKAAIRHVGWRLRPDNLWAMGPLDNLVGMQYRIDHLENLKADAADLIVHPPLVIAGEVEEFVWGPGAEIHIDEQGSVSEVSKSLSGLIQATNDIQMLEDKMELFAGAPREAMGVRSPGEKTAFEVDQLASAAGKIFQEKASTFELLLLEPNLNDMLEISHRNLQKIESISVIDSELDATIFIDIDKATLGSDGVIHPVGARHFAEQAKFVQEFTALSNTNAFQFMAPHISSKALATAFGSALNVEKLGIFKANVAVEEQMEQQKLMQGAQEQMDVENAQGAVE
tara:strand:- start:38223 stop:39971 length:1749 start_codon:yes stop_codon:yes gene_type:complete